MPEKSYLQEGNIKCPIFKIILSCKIREILQFAAECYSKVHTSYYKIRGSHLWQSAAIPIMKYVRYYKVPQPFFQNVLIITKCVVISTFRITLPSWLHPFVISCLLTSLCIALQLAFSSIASCCNSLLVVVKESHNGTLETLCNSKEKIASNSYLPHWFWYFEE